MLLSFIKKLFLGPNKAKTSPLIFILGGFFIILSLFLTNEFILANTIFSDNFESYSLGNLDNQGGWDLQGGAWDVVKDKAYEGTKSAYSITGNIQKTATSSLYYGEIEYFFYPTASTSNYFDFHIWNNPYSLFTFSRFKNGNLYLWDSCGSVFDLIKENVSLNNWISVKIEWSYIGSGVGKYRANINNEGWSAFTDSCGGTTIQYEFDSVSLISSGISIYIDRIGKFLYLGYEPIFIPENPINCETNIINFDNILFNGEIDIPSENPYTFDSLLVYLESTYIPATTTALTIEYFDISLPNLEGGDYYEYSATTTLSRDSPFWKVKYRFDGYDEWGNRTVFWYVPTEIPCNTILTENIPLPTEILEEIGFFELPEPESCEGMGITDRLLCEIKNILNSIFVPSQEKVAELNQNISLIKQKFPFNYLNIASIFYNDVKNGINNTSTILFKVLGQEGNVNFDIWENTTSTIAGTSQKIGNVLSGFFSFIFLAGFITWGIGFGKRIFK